MRKSICFMCAILVILLARGANAEPTLTRALQIRPQLKIGKIENGNSFAEIQYLKLRYDFSEQYTFEGAISTGFTGQRTSPSNANFNHSINRLGIKFTYRPLDRMGIFFEGSFTKNIEGATNPVSYFVYDNYQAIGVSWEIQSYTFE